MTEHIHLTFTGDLAARTWTHMRIAELCCGKMRSDVFYSALRLYNRSLMLSKKADLAFVDISGAYETSTFPLLATVKIPYPSYDGPAINTIDLRVDDRLLESILRRRSRSGVFATNSARDIPRSVIDAFFWYERVWYEAEFNSRYLGYFHTGTNVKNIQTSMIMFDYDWQKTLKICTKKRI
jgi:hypothetical protein